MQTNSCLSVLYILTLYDCYNPPNIRCNPLIIDNLSFGYITSRLFRQGSGRTIVLLVEVSLVASTLSGISGLRDSLRYASRYAAQPLSSSLCECRCGSPFDGENGEPLPRNRSAASSGGNLPPPPGDGSLPPGESSAGGEMGPRPPSLLLDMGSG
ncbi:unnamed protein product [Phyllotreta striolata]|uniref:Uncharacterized protein n=1 Tax=Phyllotreta striolata TaxID=444603 RepID=A0A9N9TVT7_PHYSR|nr:unnamed protein product [Phyllotreta striolata]